MTVFETRLLDVRQFFDNNDLDLGYRRLMDCCMDTQDMGIYLKCIDLTQWKESHPEDKEGFMARASQLLDRLSSHTVVPAAIAAPVINAVAITKKYSSSGFVLGPATLDVYKSHVYGLVGENGNGKTSLLRILALELSYDSGELGYSFDSVITSDYELRSRLVYVPQRTQKWYGSLKDNLKFVLSNYNTPPPEIETRMLMMIARLGLWNYQDLKWSELSSGYKMRFELARTLLRKPEVLLLDEPLANLDVLAQQVILEDLRSICNSISHPIALVLSSQQLYEVEKISDTVIYLKNGVYTEDNQKDDTTSDTQLIIEIDCNTARTTLETVLKEADLVKLEYNGGVYLAYFPQTTPVYRVLEVLGRHSINLTYLRDISRSTRRFFVS